MKRSVGLLVITNIPAMGGRVVVLQRRGKFNHEKMAPESYPGGCQASIHGGVEENEMFEQALFREAEEEFGSDFVLFLKQHLDGMSEVSIIKDESCEIRTYAIELPSDCIKVIKLRPSSGRLDFLCKDKIDSIVDIKQFTRERGVTDSRVIGMFNDARDAVMKALCGQ